MKAVISNRIYLQITDIALLNNIKNSLTYKIKKPSFKNMKGSLIEIIKNYKILPNNIISIPQGRMDLIPDGTKIIDKRVFNKMPFPIPTSSLREDQKLIFDQVNDSCFINALVGWGKTYVALHLARKLEQKTLVVTHTVLLRDQWIKEIKQLFNIDCGIIGSDEFNIDSSIVVGNVQTLTKHALKLNKEFGTIIMDEAHHCPATTFTNIIDSMYARYRIGLSGTMLRKDGKHILFKDYFGDKIFKPPQSNTLNPIVKILNSGISLKSNETWARKINELLYDYDYQNFIANIAKVQISKGHSVLIVADRVEFLENVKNIIGETCVLVTGQTTLEDREKIREQINSGKKMCIAGSRQIFSEGISINKLSSVILSVPIANESLLEQIIGRIMRKHDNKPHPEVIDITFNSYADKRQNNLRLSFYMKKGWDIVNM